jgi:hypothetical protein
MLAEGQALLMARRKDMQLAKERSEGAPALCDPAVCNFLPERSEKSPANNEPRIFALAGSPTALKQAGPDGRSEGNASEQLVAMVSGLPEHLGWGSAAQTAVLRAAAERYKNPAPKNDRERLSPEKLWPAANYGGVTKEEQPFDLTGTVSIAPSLGLAILRHKKAASARLWLLLRAADIHGQGMVPLNRARKAYTEKESSLRFCGWRQLRNLLAAGSGIFWQISGECIWLRSAVRVAEALGVPRFRGKDVAIPITALIGGIAAVRANLYAAFHSGRRAKPISRKTIARKSGIKPRTQRNYDHLSGVKKQANFARGSKVGSD